MGALTKALVESLLADNLPVKTEIIVVDNASEDESAAFLRSDFPEITVVEREENGGFAAGVNSGLEVARGRFVLLLNPDIVVDPGSVTKLYEYMQEHSDVGIAGGKLMSPNGKLQYSCYRFYRPMTILYRRTRLGNTRAGREEIDRFLMKDYDRSVVRDVDWLQGSCMMVNANAIKDVGIMDESFFMYFEDVDWCRRFWKKGWKVMYVPDATFSHFHQRGSAKRSILSVFFHRLTREHIKSGIRYFLKYRGEASPHTESTS